MKRIHLGFLTLLLFGISAVSQSPAQEGPADEPIEMGTNQPALTDSQTESRSGSAPHRSGRDQVSIGNDVTLKEDEISQDVVVIGGNAIIDGTVKGDLIVVLGSAKLGPKAEIKRDLIIVAGSLEADPAAKIGGERMIIGLDSKWAGGRWFKWPSEWFNQGLLLARPLPHQYLWSWVVAAIFLLLYVMLAILFPKPVQATVEALEAKPGSSLLVGMLAFLLIGPLMLLLVVTGVGIVIVPFLICALVAAFFFGKVAVYRYAGQQFGGQIGWTFLQQPLIALVVGVLIFYSLYIVPVLGFVVWGAIAPLGVGAVLLAFFRRYRMESSKANGSTASVALPPTVTTEPAPPGQANFTLVPRVGFWLRFLATALDFVLIGLLSALVFRSRLGFFLPLWVIYHIGMWAWKGTTIGGIVLNLKIVRTDGSPLNFAVALVRSLASFLSAAVLLLGFFWAGWSAEKQSWHDKIAGTIVVKLPKGTSLL